MKWKNNPDTRSPFKNEGWLTAQRDKLLSIFFTGLFLSPNLARAGEIPNPDSGHSSEEIGEAGHSEKTNKKHHTEPPSLEMEVGFRMGLPPKQTCDPYKYPKGGVRLSREVTYDSHGHAIGKEESGENCSPDHPPVSLGFSYLWAPPLNQHKEEEAIRLPESNEEEGEEEGLAGHPPHRFKLQLGFSVRQRLEILPKVELALVPKDRPQFGFGAPVSVHLGGYHEVALAWITRFSRQKLQNWEAQFLYTTRLVGPLSITALCMAEGHDGEVNIGCGGGLGLNFRRASFTFDAAGGKGFQHYHLALTLGFGGAGGHQH